MNNTTPKEDLVRNSLSVIIGVVISYIVCKDIYSAREMYAPEWNSIIILGMCLLLGAIFTGWFTIMVNAAIYFSWEEIKKRLR